VSKEISPRAHADTYVLFVLILNRRGRFANLVASVLQWMHSPHSLDPRSTAVEQKTINHIIFTFFTTPGARMTC
jgi:hypothetical protein